jgi:hypothetical protein
MPIRILSQVFFFVDGKNIPDVLSKNQVEIGGAKNSPPFFLRVGLIRGAN